MLLLKNLADASGDKKNLLSQSSSKSSAALQRVAHSERAFSLEVTLPCCQVQLVGSAGGFVGISRQLCLQRLSAETTALYEACRGVLAELIAEG
jgi:hypothetical protein